MIDERFIILAVVIDAVGSIGYLIDTLSGKTKPNKVTWFLWTLLPAIALIGMIDENASKTSLILTFMFAFMPFLIFLASFVNKESFWKLTRFDLTCGVLSSLGILAWLITSDGNITIIFSLFANFLALLPTLVKAFKLPDTESWLVYLNGGLASFITLLTLDAWDFASAVFPVYFVISCMVMFLLVRFKIGAKLISFRYESNEV